MSELLDKKAVAHRLNVSEITAAALMTEMNPVPITGTVRHKWAVTEASLEAWIARKQKLKGLRYINNGSKRRLERK